MENEQLSLKRALLVSARDTLTHTSQSSLDELTYSALIATHFPTDASCAPQSFADTALITGDPNPTLSFTLLNTNEQTCLLRARIFDTWSSLLEEWNLHSDYHAQLKCDAPLSVSSALNSCASHLQWQNYGVAGPHLLVDNFWSLHLSHASISNLSITSPLPAIEVTP